MLLMDLRAVQGIQERLALDHRIVAALLQWFGVAQPVQITADGLINPEGWQAANKSAATQWQASVQISRL